MSSYTTRARTAPTPRTSLGIWRPQQAQIFRGDVYSTSYRRNSKAAEPVTERDDRNRLVQPQVQPQLFRQPSGHHHADRRSYVTLSLANNQSRTSSSSNQPTFRPRPSNNDTCHLHDQYAPLKRPRKLHTIATKTRPFPSLPSQRARITVAQLPETGSNSSSSPQSRDAGYRNQSKTFEESTIEEYERERDKDE